MNSIRKHSVAIGSYRTSISLEDEFWKGLRYIAMGRGSTLGDLVAEINADRQSANLSSAIRLFVLRYYRDQADHPLTFEFEQVREAVRASV